MPQQTIFSDKDPKSAFVESTMNEFQMVKYLKAAGSTRESRLACYDNIVHAINAGHPAKITSQQQSDLLHAVGNLVMNDEEFFHGIASSERERYPALSTLVSKKDILFEQIRTNLGMSSRRSN